MTVEQAPPMTATPHRLRDWHPGWSGVVLGTGGAAVAGLVDPWSFTRADEVIGASLAAVAAVLLPILVVPYVLRRVRHREAMLGDLRHPGLGALYGTVPAGFLIVGLALAQVAVLGWLPTGVVWLVAVLLGVGLVGAIAVGVSFFSGVVAREQVPPEAMTGAWFIPIVVLVLVPSVLARIVLLEPGWLSSTLVVLAASSVGAGFLLFLLLAPVIAWRLITGPAPAAHQAATWWIWLAPAGAGGLGILATSRLAAALLGGTTAQVLPTVGLLVATSIWGLGAWWTVFAGRIVLSVARTGGGLPFGIGSWGFAFPTAAMTALTVELGRTWDAPVLQVLGGLGFLATVLVWLWLAVRTLSGLRSGRLLER